MFCLYFILQSLSTPTVQCTARLTTEITDKLQILIQLYTTVVYSTGSLENQTEKVLSTIVLLLEY